MDYSECFVSQVYQVPGFPAHLKPVGMGGNRFSLHRELGQEVPQVEKALCHDKWPNLFLLSNCSKLVQLGKSVSLLLRIG